MRSSRSGWYNVAGFIFCVLVLSACPNITGLSELSYGAGEAGASCRVGSDCVSEVCSVEGICQAPTCADGTHNGDETNVDCGGTCGPCELGGCIVAADCSSK